ncbi:MAG: DUF5320 domain-containing protein [Limnochordia bacterium]|jgi:hypothetical protein
MPRFDGTGPWGCGPMAGWGRGPCATGYPRWGRGRFGPGWGFDPLVNVEPQSQTEILKAHKEFLQARLNIINERLAKITDGEG